MMPLGRRPSLLPSPDALAAPVTNEFGDCGDLNHDLLNMDDEQLAAEMTRLESLPVAVP